MWRIADETDDEAIVRMCLALNAEDPGPRPVPREHTERTLRANELGGEVCTIDELYVDPEHRRRGCGTELLEGLSGRAAPWASSAVALTLEVTPDNVYARRLYERLGFHARNLVLRRRLPGFGAPKAPTRDPPAG
jgi:ribosomal protein S18 acetylase RimI-like enzyme